MRYTLDFEIEEGDLLRFNDKWWTVTDVDWTHTITVENQASGLRTFDKDDLQRLLDTAGNFQFVKEAYTDVVRE